MPLVDCAEMPITLRKRGRSRGEAVIGESVCVFVHWFDFLATCQTTPHLAMSQCQPEKILEQEPAITRFIRMFPTRRV